MNSEPGSHWGHFMPRLSDIPEARRQSFKRPNATVEIAPSKRQRLYSRINGANKDSDGSEYDEGSDEERALSGDDFDPEIEAGESGLTTGLEVSTVRSLVLGAVQTHPTSIKYVEAVRPTVLDGLSDESLRLTLLRIAQEHPDVANKVKQQRKDEHLIVLDFLEDVVDANNSIHSLDDLQEMDKLGRSYEIERDIEGIILRIMGKVDIFSQPESRTNALDAILLIAQGIFGADGEIGRELIGKGSALARVASGLRSLVEVMPRGEKRGALEKLKNLGEKMEDYSENYLFGLIKDIEALDSQGWRNISL